MIIKSFELLNKTITKKYYLLYGKNIGFIEDALEQKIIPSLTSNIRTYEETHLMNNLDNFKEEVFNKSFFEDEKLIIIKRVSDKIFLTIKDIISSSINGISIVLISSNLDKKSKIRNFFEKNTETICVPFYEDTDQSLRSILFNFLKEKKINFSSEAANLIIEKANGNRIYLKNELKKIEHFALDKKTISLNDILKLVNSAENYDYSDLINYCLKKNQKKIIKILNENNFTTEDSLIILRIFISKLKRLLFIKKKIMSNIDTNKSIESFKPTIFWKEKEDIKEQIKIWSVKNCYKILSIANKIELLIKKNPSLSMIYTTNFLIKISI